MRNFIPQKLIPSKYQITAARRISMFCNTFFFFYKHSVNLTQPQLCLRFLLFLNNRPIVLSIVLPKNLSLSLLINVMLIKKKSMLNATHKKVVYKNFAIILDYYNFNFGKKNANIFEILLRHFWKLILQIWSK